jgi:hypothetical protein
LPLSILVVSGAADQGEKDAQWRCACPILLTTLTFERHSVREKFHGAWFKPKAENEEMQDGYSIKHPADYSCMYYTAFKTN